MKPPPAEECKPPGYPTRAELAGQQNLLASLAPRGWRTGRILAPAAALLAAAVIAGCHGDPGRPTEDANWQRMPAPIVMEASGWVRSIFDVRPYFP